MEKKGNQEGPVGPPLVALALTSLDRRVDDLEARVAALEEPKPASTTVDIKVDYGAKGDGQEVTATLTIPTGGNKRRLTSATNLWAREDVVKKIFVGGAGSPNPTTCNDLGVLESTIVTYIAPNVIEIAHDAETPLDVSQQIVAWGTDDTAAFRAFNAAHVGQTGVALTIPASSGFYCIWETLAQGDFRAEGCLFCHGIKQVAVTGTGTPRPTLKIDAAGMHICGVGCGSAHNLQGPALMSTPAFYHSSTRVNTMAAGADLATCTTYSEASKFAADDWAVLLAVDAQVGGYPPNPTYYEYFQVASSDAATGAVTFTSNVVSTKFLSTYPGGFGCDIEIGPATLHKLAPSWNTECRWEKLHVSDLAGALIGHQMAVCGRAIVLSDCDLDVVINATMCKSLKTPGSNWLQGSEVDKINESISIDGGNINVLAVQSGSSAKNLSIGDAHVFRLAGTPENISIDGATIDEFKVGSAGASPKQAVAVKNSIVSSFPSTESYVVLHVDDVDSWSTMTGGVITTTSDAGNAGLVTMYAPGNTWMMAGPGSNPDIFGPAFKVLSISGSTPQGPHAGPFTPITIVTDLPGGWPSIPGGGAKSIIKCPMPSITFVNTHGCTEADDLSNAPPGRPLLSYLKRLSTDRHFLDLFYVLGAIESLTIDVLTPHATGPLYFAPLASGDNEPVVLVDGTTTPYFPHIDLTTVGKRVITPAGVTNDRGINGGVGGLGADSNLTLPKPYAWMYNPSRSFVSADMSGETTGLSYYWEIITDQGVAQRHSREGGREIMTLGLCFYILLLIWAVFGLFVHFGPASPYGFIGNSILLFVLFLLLGWQVFGPPLHRG